MRSEFCFRILIICFFCFSFTVLSQSSYAQGNECSGAASLTSTTSCTIPSSGGGAYTMDNATASAGIPAGCTAGTHYDVWFSFVAANTTQTVTIGNFGDNITSPEVQMFSGTCGTLSAISGACASTTITVTTLTVGTTYYIRVSNVGTSPSGSGNRPKFDICLTHPLPPPSNDECSNSILLYSNTSCSNTSATLGGATASATIPLGCAVAGTYYDVWFSFVAASAVSETITLSSLTGITSQRIQIYSGSCGSLTSVACGITSSLTASGLSVGTTYYVRVSNFNAAATSTGNFNICITHPAPVIPSIDYGKSYVNITNNTGGGTIDPGDILEIRATLVIRAGALDSLAFLDTLESGSGVSFVSGSLATRTNEGKVYKAFTDAVADDEGYVYTSGTDNIIRINFGATASATKRGRLTNASKPALYGPTCIIMVTYRVVVTAGYNATLNLGGGKFTTSVTTGVVNDVSFSARNAIVYSSPGLCPNSVAASNAVGGDFNGTFGSAAAQNRGASSNVTGYTYATFNANAPGDYYYGIANNTSATGNTTTTWAKPSSPHRVFSQWDISGDHTGAANTAKGNLPCNPSLPISSTNPCGYMLVVNSAYKTDTAFQYTVNSLCPNTYYEISAWLKNMCYKCGYDSNAVGANDANYIPTGPNDSSGVKPNLTFDINGIDYYTTGDVQYGGLFPSTQTGSDSNNVWVKRGFTYLTGPAQTSFTLTIRNNAPGGGGNDWAMDDIALATCSPDLSFTPSSEPFVCTGNNLDITGTVTSYFNNYTNYIWQKSINGGTTWTNETTPAVGSPTVNGSGQYVYSVGHSTGVLTTADNGIQYRLITATTPSNLSSSSCILSGSVEVIPDIDTCTPVLGINLISFNAQQEGTSTVLRWSTTKETELLKFAIEGSANGRDFETLGVMNSSGNSANVLNAYNWSEKYHDAKYYYRIKMTGKDNGTKYSRIIVVDGLARSASLVSIVNPFHNALIAEVQIPEAGIVRLQLVDNNGVIVQTQNVMVQQGKNKVNMNNVSGLAAGMYTLKILTNQTVLSKKVIKQ